MAGSFDTNVPIDSSATVHEIVVTFDIISCDGPLFYLFVAGSSSCLCFESFRNGGKVLL